MTHIGFWFNNHPLTPMATTLFEQFIPAEGPTAYVESEVVRAVLRLNYDFYNNGFGNNMSEAVAYIEKYHKPSAEFKAAFTKIKEVALEPWVRVPLTDDDFNTIIAEAYTRLRDGSADGKLTPLTEEMFDMPFVETDFPEDAYDEDDEG
jgi:hypothetical protein